MGKMKTIRKLILHLQGRIRLNDRSYRVYSVLRLLVLITAIRCVLQGNYENFALCILSLILFLLPAFFEERLKVEIPPLFEVIIYLFIYAAEILGEINQYYTAIPGWDTMLHTLNGFLCAAIGFSLVYILNRQSTKLNLTPLYLAMVAFCFSMTIGVIWEFFEFSMDQLFGLDMQKDFIVSAISSVTLDPNQSQVPYAITNITRTLVETTDGTVHTIEGGYLDIGIIDTMKDLLVNFLGAIVFSVIGYFYARHDEKNPGGKIAESLILRTLSDEALEEQNQVIEKMNEERKQKGQKKNRRKNRKK